MLDRVLDKASIPIAQPDINNWEESNANAEFSAYNYDATWYLQC